MEKDKLYPELIDYIYYNCWHQFLPKVSGLQRHAIHMQLMRQTPWGLTIHADARTAFVDGILIKDEEDLDQLLTKGMDEFKKEIVLRAYAIYGSDLELNTCPQCGKVTRTPLAKQCRFCFYQWHGKY